MKFAPIKISDPDQTPPNETREERRENFLVFYRTALIHLASLPGQKLPADADEETRHRVKHLNAYIVPDCIRLIRVRMYSAYAHIDQDGEMYDAIISDGDAEQMYVMDARRKGELPKASEYTDEEIEQMITFIFEGFQKYIFGSRSILAQKGRDELESVEYHVRKTIENLNELLALLLPERYGKEA